MAPASSIQALARTGGSQKIIIGVNKNSNKIPDATMIISWDPTVLGVAEFN
jgi:hypothetical protein